MAIGKKHAAYGLGVAAFAALLGVGLGAARSQPAPEAARVAAFRPAHLAAVGHFREAFDVSAFQRGNLHGHSTRSDGNVPPEKVYAFYREHGYNFTSLTDHNQLTQPDEFKSQERKGFVLLPGEEVTIYVGKVPVHVNGVCTSHAIGNAKFEDIHTALGWAVKQVRAQDAMALINHPNFEWALQAGDLTYGRDAQLVEIWSAHPYVHSEGDATRPSEEAIWDQTLTDGLDFGPAAVDDSHHYKPEDKEPTARPGKGWVYTFGGETKRKPICDALRAGKLYASNGGVLTRIRVTREAITVWPEGEGGTVEFIGSGGRVLDTQTPAAGAEASYAAKGGEGYVRVRLTRPDGKKAWTRAYRVETDIRRAD
jgi:hypothetical protein